MAAAAAIEYRDVSKRYGDVLALDHVSLEVRRGEILGFLGPNGAGKSTAIRLLFDIIRPNGGRVLVLDHDCQADGVAARRCMGYLPGEVNLYEGLTGRQTIELFSGLGVDVDQAYLARLMDELDFNPDRNVGAYSKGNRQKLGLILAMMHRPPVLVLDEPTSGLDPLIQERVADLLEDAASAGSTVFFSSHVLSEVERMCHRVAIIRSGQLVAVEEVGAIKGRSLHILEVTFAEPVAPHAFELPGVRLVSHDRTMLRLEVQDNLDAVIKEVARHPVLDLRTEQPSLEDVFRAYYEEPAAEVREPAAEVAS